MTAPAGARTVLYDTPQLVAVIDEMARQANGLLHGAHPVAVIGVRRRGAPLADVSGAGPQPPMSIACTATGRKAPRTSS